MSGNVVGAFLGGPDFSLPAGKASISLCVNTMDRQNLSASFTVTATGFSQVVQADASGRGYIEVDAGKTYTIELDSQGYANTGPQTVIAESNMNYGVLFDLLDYATSTKDGVMTKEQVADLMECGDKTVKEISVDFDTDRNLIVKLTREDGTVIQDSEFLGGLTGALYVNDVLIDATIKITNTATQAVIYSGPMVVDRYDTGMGSVNVEVTQYGATISQDIEVIGDTNLVLNDVVKLTPTDDSYEYKIGSGTRTSGVTYVIKNQTYTVTWYLGTWPDGTEISGTYSIKFSADVTGPDSSFESTPYLIRSSGSFIVPITATYAVVLTGGGGGGGGGSCGGRSGYTGNGGAGGRGGYVCGYKIELNEGASIPVTIGAGGAGGAGSTSYSSPYASSGSTGGTTIFGEYSAIGGAGGSEGSVYYVIDNKYGGSGGAGSNNETMSIFGKSYSRGAGGTRGTTSTNPGSGGSTTVSISGLTRVGYGGDGGSAYSTYMYGGDGGYGFVCKGYDIGVGGSGGTGYSEKTSLGRAGTDGKPGGVALKVVMA